MTIDYKDLGARIKVKREAKGYSQAEFAHEVQLSTQHISNIENAKSKVSLDKLVCIANTLDSSVDELVCGSMRKSRDIYIEDINVIVEGFNDIEVRALPELLRHYKALSSLLEKSIKEK